MSAAITPGENQPRPSLRFYYAFLSGVLNLNFIMPFSAQSAEEDEAEENFYLRRKLTTPFADHLSIWGLIVGIVLPGLFTGFNHGFEYGLGSMIVANAISCILVLLVSLSLTELGTSFPFASGCLSYGRAAFGGTLAMIIGISYMLEMFFILTTRTVELSNIIIYAFGLTKSITPMFWVLSLVLALYINLSPRIFFGFAVFMSSTCILILAVSIAITIPTLDFTRAFTTLLNDGTVSTKFLPYGITGVIQSIPFSLYLWVSFEILPAASEETADVKQNLARGMFNGMATITVLSWLTLLLTAAMKPDLHGILLAASPIGLGLKSAVGFDNSLFNIITIPALFLGQVCGLYAGSRFLYGLSRGGYLHSFISFTNQNGAPFIALLIILIFVFLFSVLASFTTNQAQLIFLNAGTMFALCSYIFEPLVFIKLRYSLPNLPRPYKSPLGIPGAVIQLLIALFALFGNVSIDNLSQQLIIVVAVVVIVSTLIFKIFVEKGFDQEGQEKLFIKKQLRFRTSENRQLNNPNVEVLAVGVPQIV